MRDRVGKAVRERELRDIVQKLEKPKKTNKWEKTVSGKADKVEKIGVFSE